MQNYAVCDVTKLRNAGLLIVRSQTDYCIVAKKRNCGKRFGARCRILSPISGRVDRGSATEAVDSGSIPSRI